MMYLYLQMNFLYKKGSNIMSQQLPPDGGQPWNPHQPGYSRPLYNPPSQPGYPPQQPVYPQSPTFYPPHQLGYPQPGQMQPPPFTPPPSKRTRIAKWMRRHPVWTAIIVIVCLSIVIGPFTGNHSDTTSTTASVAPTHPATTVVPTATLAPTPKPKPTPTPKPTVSPAQLEALYKSITTTTTVDALDKDGAADKGHDVHFTGRLLKFVKDDSGNTAGANVDDPNTASSSVIQVVFPKGTDINQLNEGNTIEIWGTDAGVFSGTNTFGGTVQEVGIATNYLTDQTTTYSTNS
jgi:hypothetical protein